MRCSRPGRPRHGHTLKQTYTVSLDPQVADNLRVLGRDNLSAGIEIAEFRARASPLLMPPKARDPFVDRHWIVFEIVDGPADPPAPGDIIDPFREVLHT